MKRIIVSVTNDLTTDQRVHKVCSTLTEMNYNVLLVGRRLNTSNPISRKYKTHRLKLVFNSGILFYIEYNIRLFFLLLFSKKELLLANDLDTLLSNFMASKFSNCTLIYDSHELFTEVPELTNRPFPRKIWELIERFILPKVTHCYTVCNSIANYYNDKYNTNFKVVRNVPKQLSLKKGEFPFSTSNKKIILYQGALNIGRGLEMLIDCMPFLNNCLLIIIGDGDIAKDLKNKVVQKRLEDQVKFISRIEPSKLKTLTPLADLGVSLEEDLGLNYKFALPNKLFDYIQAEIPVLVSNLPEMKDIVEKYNIGEVVKSRVPQELAHQIEHIITNKISFTKPLKIATQELNWELESEKLKEIFNTLDN